MDEYQSFTALRETASANARLVRINRMLMANSFENLLEAQVRVLSGEHQGLVLTGREIRDSVWIGWNANVHSSATLIAPVYIGENCSIGQRTQVGPGVAVGKGSLIDRFSVVERSLVYPGSYIGEGLEVRDAVVSGNRLVNTRLGGEIHDEHDILLGHVAGFPVGAWLRNFREFLFAGGAWGREIGRNNGYR
jgi:bifunctional N-acetylglucosamine-1-phosphate-uridyltransferase/glucosamine-1-phosphate-acetyltransferase GlmU-like protein